MVPGCVQYGALFLPVFYNRLTPASFIRLCLRGTDCRPMSVCSSALFPSLVLIVKTCQSLFSFDLPCVIIEKRAKMFKDSL